MKFILSITFFHRIIQLVLTANRPQFSLSHSHYASSHSIILNIKSFYFHEFNFKIKLGDSRNCYKMNEKKIDTLSVTPKNVK